MFEATGVLLRRTQRKTPEMKRNKLAYKFSNTLIK